MTAGTELSAIVPEKWSANYYDTLLQSLPFRGAISSEYENEIQDLGDTVNVSDFPQFSDADLLDEAERADAEALTVNTQQLVINKRAFKDFIVTKKATLQSLPHMDQLQNLAIFAIMKRMQKEIIDDTIPSAAAPDHAIAYDSGTTLALADILEGKELQDVALNAAANRWLITDAPQMNDIFNITGFTSSDFLLSGAPLQTGQIPTTLLSYIPEMTTEASALTFLFHTSYMTLAVQQGMTVEQFNLGVDGTRGTRVNVDTLFGNRQLSDERVVTIS